MNFRPPDHGPDDVGSRTRVLLLAAGLASVGLAALAWLSPTHTMPWPLAPLHAACFAALQAASALPWLLAARERDSAVLRIPLAQMLAGSGCTVLLVTLRSSELATLEPVAWAWLGMQAGLAVGAALWLGRQSDIQAPAERPDRALIVAAILVGAASLLLAADPAGVAGVWPWPLAPEPARLYGGSGAGWAVLLAMSAHERRRDARRLAMWGLVALGGLVTLASWRHREAFHHLAAGLAWTTAFLALSTLAALRLTRPGRARWRARFRRARPSDR